MVEQGNARATVDAYLELSELDYFEVQEAFKGLADENVWKRPAPGLLSIGELAGHIAYWEAVRLAGEGEDLAKCKVKSPLVDPRFRYYTTNLDIDSSKELRSMSAEQVCQELLRVHREATDHFNALGVSIDDPVPGLSAGGGGWTYRENLKYRVFHVAYHTGQMYSVRHLLGEETPDN